MKQIAIVGGGISGLAAALTLSRFAQVQSTLFEASERLGGVLETIQAGDYLIERSADNFSTLIPDALVMSTQFGIADDLIQPNLEGRQAFVYLGGRIHPIPAGFSLMQPTRWMSILTTPTLSWFGKMRLLGEYWIPSRKLGTESGRSDSIANQFESPDESLESFAVRRLGREAFERLVEPIISGIFTADPRTLSMAATMPQFLEMERKYGGLIRGHLSSKRMDSAAAARRASGARYDTFVAPRHGMSAWIEGLTRQLPPETVRLNTRVSAVYPACSERGESKWRLGLSGPSSGVPNGPSSELFDAVLLATPAHVTAGLLAEINPAATDIVGNISYASSVVVAMVVHKEEIKARLDGFGLVVPRQEKRDTLAISYTSNKYPGRVPHDQILIRIFLGGARRPDVVEWSDHELLKVAHSEVQSILGWCGSLPLWQSVIRWKDAMPQYLVGHVGRMQELQELLAAQPTLQLCGAAYQGVGIPQCVRSGRAAAERLILSLGMGDALAESSITR